MRKKLLYIVIICIIIVSISLNVFSINEVINEQSENINTVEENKTLEQKQSEIQSKLEESNSKLEYVKEELSVSLQKVQELSDSITNYQNQYDTLEGQIIGLEADIENTNITLAQVKDEYDKKERLLKKRIVALYEAGEASYLDLLLTSTNIIEFISNYFIIGEILECDNNMLDEIEAKQKLIEQSKEKQEKQQTELKVAKTQSNKTRILLENTRIIQEIYMTQLTDEEKTLEEQITKYKQEQKEIEDQILLAINWSGRLSIQFNGGPMIWPVAIEGTYISSEYGNRLHPIQGIYKNHDGIDITGSEINGAPVVSSADGVVIYANWMSGYGNCVMVAHGDGIISLYGHGLEILSEVGQDVKQGDIIMKVGSTGNSTGPHLHFEIRKDGVAKNPIPYLNGEIKNISAQDIESQNNIIN